MKMKKFLLVLILFSTLMLTGCKKEKKEELGEIDYHPSGFYILVIDTNDFKIGGLNPTVYLDHQNDSFNTDSGQIFDIGPITFSEKGKVINTTDGIKNYNIYATIILPENAPSEITLYQIKANLNGDTFIDLESAVKVDVSKDGKYTYSADYQINQQKYHYQIVLGYSRAKEA